jgi:hypothetical protein
MFLELKPFSATPVFWMILAIVCAAVLAVLVTVILKRRFYRLCISKAVASENMTVSSDSNNSRNGLSNEEIHDLLSTYDFSLEVPQDEFVTCKSDFE